MAINIIRGYITPEEAEAFCNYLDGYVRPSGNPKIMNALGYPSSLVASKTGYETGAIHGLDDPINKAIGKLFEDVKSEAESFFETEIDLCQASYQVLLPGGSNPLHADAMNLDGSPLQDDGTEEEIRWSGLIYLNTSGKDFLGGNLSFPEFDINYAPSIGDLVLFPGDAIHRHAVSTVESGERKNIVFFWADKGNVSDAKFFS